MTYKIAAVSSHAPKNWTTGNGVAMETYQVKFENVDGIVEVNKKAGNKPVVGTTVEGYITEDPKWGKKFKSSASNLRPVSNKDGEAIKAMWAIGQAITKVEFDIDPAKDSGVQSGLVTVEGIARELFDMVDRVKAGKDVKDEFKEDTKPAFIDAPDDGFLDHLAATEPEF